MWVTVDDSETRVIDNNELSMQKIQESYEEDQRRKAKESSFEEANFAQDGYADSYDDENYDDKIDELTAPRDDMGDMPSEMSLDDFGGSFEEGGGDILENAEASSQAERPKEKYVAPAEDTIPPNTKKEIDQILEDAQVQANKIVADARNEAQDILAKAHDEGRQQGYDDGYNAGIAEANLKADELFEQKKIELENDYAKLTSAIEPEMVDTLTKIYEHVFGVSLQEDKNIILHLLQTALSRVDSSGALLVHISPDDYDMVMDAKDELVAALTNPDANLEIVEDPTLNENECIIETDGGIFDCSVGVELEELSRKLKLLSYDRKRN